MKWSVFVRVMIGVVMMPMSSALFAAPAPKAAHAAAAAPAVQAAHAPPAASPIARNEAGAAPRVDFIKDVHPILQARCASCHLGGNRQGGLQMDSRAAILAGGTDGPVVVPGHSEASLLLKLVTGKDPSRVMPAGGPRLTDAEVSVLRNWIDEGVSFNGAKVTSTAFYEAPLAPRLPRVPPAPAGDPAMNPIDRLLLRYFHERKIQPRPIVDDRTYARRVYLDIVGLLPSVSELQAFERDRTPGKRAILAQRLLNDNQDYAVHWLSFWNDALRNDYAGTGYIDGGRKQITRWLYDSLVTDKPYNKFVAELVNPGPESEGFANGIVWRGTVNASQTPQMQAAQNISQVFLGINLKCASCHDSFISNWKLKDSYGMAGIYADRPLETVRCDIPTGQIARVKFLYPGLGSIDANAPRSQRLQQLATILTSQADGRLTRTIVNRLWQRFFGRGLVEPADSMDNRPWHSDVLDWLAWDLSSHGYDLKRTMLLMATSRAYQLPSAPATERTDHFTFTGPIVRRMSAEQFVDAVSSLTGVWPSVPNANIVENGIKLTGKWIWDDPAASHAVPGERIYLRKVISLPEIPARAAAVMSCDNEFTLFINGKKAAASDEWQKPVAIDLRPFLVKGQNTFAVEAINWPDPVTGKGRDVASGPNAAGFVFVAKIDSGPGGLSHPANASTSAASTTAAGSSAASKSAAGTSLISASPAGASPPNHAAGEGNWDFASDSSWLASKDHPVGWERPGFDEAGWKPAAELTDASTGYALGGLLSSGLMRLLSPGLHVRSALVTADPLTTALGRPNREQVVTERSSAATTLQALELTNGRVLSGVLKQGARNWLARGLPPRQLASAIFLQSLGRQPTRAETPLALSLLGSPVDEAGVEDLVWTIIMLPEFQLIY